MNLKRGTVNHQHQQIHNNLKRGTVVANNLKRGTVSANIFNNAPSGSALPQVNQLQAGMTAADNRYSPGGKGGAMNKRFTRHGTHTLHHQHTLDADKWKGALKKVQVNHVDLLPVLNDALATAEHHKHRFDHPFHPSGLE